MFPQFGCLSLFVSICEVDLLSPSLGRVAIYSRCFVGGVALRPSGWKTGLAVVQKLAPGTRVHFSRALVLRIHT